MAFRVGASNAGEIARRMEIYGQRVVRKALPAALNRTSATIRTVGTRLAAKEVGITQQSVRRGITVQRANRGKHSVAIIFAGRPISLIRFNARQTRPGVAASAYGVRRVYRGTFIATIAMTGVTQVFKRTSDRSYPIKKLWGPGLAQVASKPSFRAAVDDTARTRFPVELDRALAASARGVLGRRS